MSGLFYQKNENMMNNSQFSGGQQAEHSIIRAHYTILVVDDTRLNLMVATKLLECLGYRFATATNGKSAVQAVENGTYDLILMDCHMPMMTGYKATQMIRRLPSPKCDTPVIALTTCDTQENMSKCIDAGMNDLIVKPLYHDMLDALIIKWIAKGERIDHQSLFLEDSRRNYYA
jgi:CheY-like chemotaxis protein